MKVKSLFNVHAIKHLATGMPTNALLHDQTQYVSHQLCKDLQHPGYTYKLTRTKFFFTSLQHSSRTVWYTHLHEALRKPGGSTMCPPDETIVSNVNADTLSKNIHRQIQDFFRILYNKYRVNKTFHFCFFQNIQMIIMIILLCISSIYKYQQ